jgi:phospholipid transport system substrate-binding protein
MVTTYAARFKSYKGQKFEVGEVKQPAENRTLVETKLIRSNGEPVALNYLFRPDADGNWKIIDIYLSGAISEMARMRSDFSATVTGGGANALIAALEKKIVDIKAEPEQ